jgi:hypothetical protein
MTKSADVATARELLAVADLRYRMASVHAARMAGEWRAGEAALASTVRAIDALADETMLLRRRYRDAIFLDEGARETCAGGLRAVAFAAEQANVLRAEQDARLCDQRKRMQVQRKLLLAREVRVDVYRLRLDRLELALAEMAEEAD